MESTPAGRLGKEYLLWTRRAVTAAGWQCSIVHYRILELRPSISLVLTSSASIWRQGNGGGTSWDVTSPLKTPWWYRVSSPRSISGPGAPNYWWRKNSTLICRSWRAIRGERTLRRRCRRRAMKICRRTSSRSGYHGAGTEGRGELSRRGSRWGTKRITFWGRIAVSSGICLSGNPVITQTITWF